MFTKFDMLVSRHEQSIPDEMELPDEEIDDLVLKRAEDDFKVSCVNPLDQLGHNLRYAKVSGSVHGLPSSIHALCDITCLCRATSIPKIAFKPDQHHPRARYQSRRG